MQGLLSPSYFFAFEKSILGLSDEKLLVVKNIIPIIINIFFIIYFLNIKLKYQKSQL